MNAFYHYMMWFRAAWTPLRPSTKCQAQYLTPYNTSLMTFGYAVYNSMPVIRQKVLYHCSMYRFRGRQNYCKPRRSGIPYISMGGMMMHSEESFPFAKQRPSLST